MIQEPYTLLLSFNLEKALVKNWSQEYGYFSYKCESFIFENFMDLILKNINRFFNVKKTNQKLSEKEYLKIRRKMSDLVKNFHKNDSQIVFKFDGKVYQLIINVTDRKNLYQILTYLGDSSYSLIDKNDFIP